MLDHVKFVFGIFCLSRKSHRYFGRGSYKKRLSEQGKEKEVR